MRETSGAAGSKGWAGRLIPSTTGPKPPGNGSVMPPVLRFRWWGGTGGNLDWTSSNFPADISSNLRQSFGAISNSFKTNSVVLAAISRVYIRTPGPLSIDALLKWGAASGMAYKHDVFAPPPDSPKIMTLSGSPPKRPIFRWTHSRPRIISRTPRLPEPA